MKDSKKNLLILLLIFSISILFSSCLFDLKNKHEQEGQVSINLKNIMANSYSDQEILVILTNVENGVLYKASTDRTKESQELIFDKIPYGKYTVLIRITIEDGRVKSEINDDLIVSEEKESKVYGKIGAPNKIDANSMFGSIRTFEDEGEPFYEFNFGFYPVSSNYTDNFTNYSADYIEYTLYISLSKDQLNDGWYIIKENETSTKKYSYKRGEENNRLLFSFKKPKDEVNEMISEFNLESGNLYYWDIIASNEPSSNESYGSTISPLKNVIVDSLEDTLNTIENRYDILLREKGYVLESSYWTKSEKDKIRISRIGERINLSFFNESDEKTKEVIISVNEDNLIKYLYRYEYEEEEEEDFIKINDSFEESLIVVKFL